MYWWSEAAFIRVEAWILILRVGVGVSVGIEYISHTDTQMPYGHFIDDLKLFYPSQSTLLLSFGDGYILHVYTLRSSSLIKYNVISEKYRLLHLLR